MDYPFKPLDPDELRAKVTAFLDRHRLQAEDRDRRRRYSDRLINSSEAKYREAAEGAERARAALQQADRAKNDFLSRMSHELRTPLNAILGYIQLLDLGILGTVTPEQHTHLNRVRQSAVHLLSLVNDILDLVTLDVTGAELRIRDEIGLLAEACETALALVRIEAATRNITVDSPATSAPGAVYVGDAHRVRQVLIHLLTNALKFTAPGGTVRVTCGTSDTGDDEAASSDGRSLPGVGPWAYVRVTDTGIGIAPDDLSSIFDAFVQVDGGRTRAEGGTGLGLTVSRRLARAMGGEVTASSRLGEGSVFTLWLPAPVTADRIAGKVVVVESGVDGGGSASWYLGLAALGGELSRAADDVASRHAARLRTDSSLPDVRELPDAQLRDHTATLVGEIAWVLTVTGQSEGRAPELLRDGGEILRVVSELHGAQRHRLGWSEADFTREVELLNAEIVATLERAAERGVGDVEAREQATALVQRLVEQSRQTSLRGFLIAGRAGSMQG